jgi:Tol biopolymer transport system component
MGVLSASVLGGSVLGALTLHSSTLITDRPQPQKPPYAAGHVTEPRLFAEGVISTEDDESNGSFSPDGSEFFFAKALLTTTFPRLGVLCVSRFRNGHWSEPEILPFSGGQYLDISPRISPDGNTMFFSSTRVAPGFANRALRIWSVQRTATGWGEPQPLPVPVNTADNNWNWSPSVTRDGTLYFASTRDGGRPHIFRSRFVNGAYSEPEKLGPEINSEFSEADPFVSPDEEILVFASSGNGPPGGEDRPETIKGGGVPYARSDVYVSFRQDSKWSPAKHLEHHINTFADENAPSITPDGKYFFFSSERSPFTVPAAHPLNHEEIERMLHSTLNGHGNIFYISTDALDPPKSAAKAAKGRPR